MNINDPNYNTLIKLKNGDFFKLIFTHPLRPHEKVTIIGIFKKLTLKVWGDTWHKINCHFFINSKGYSFINDSCGVTISTKIYKLTLNDYLTLTEKLKEEKVIFNKKSLKIISQVYSSLNKA